MIDDSTIKSFLRLDTDEDISLYARAAEQYFFDAVGRDPDPDQPRDIYAVCAITQELYDNRTMVTDEKTDKLRRVIQSMLDHVRLEGGDDDEG